MDDETGQMSDAYYLRLYDSEGVLIDEYNND